MLGATRSSLADMAPNSIPTHCGSSSSMGQPDAAVTAAGGVSPKRKDSQDAAVEQLQQQQQPGVPTVVVNGGGVATGAPGGTKDEKLSLSSAVAVIATAR